MEQEEKKEMRMDSLFPELDEDQTIEKCKHYLEKVYPRLKLISHVEVGTLKSPNMDGMPRADTKTNTLPDTIVRRIYAKQAVQYTKRAIYACANTDQQILKGLYLRFEQDQNVFGELNLSETRYYKKYKPHALLAFADAYLYEDLHVYKTGVNRE